MAGRNTIEVKLVGDSSDLERALNRAGKTTQTNMQKIGKAAKVGAFALGGLLAAGAVVGFKELSEMQKVTAQTEAVLKSTSNAAGVTAEHIRELAEATSAYSGQDDEAVQAGENLLLTFHKIANVAGENNDIFDQTVAVTADLAQAMGMDMTKAALQLGKALNDPFRGYTRLQRIGVAFDAGQVKAIKTFQKTGNVIGAQKVILAELNKEFGGSAKAFGQTMPGRLKIAQESFRNLSAELMIGLLPAIEAIAEKLTVFAAYLRENPKLAKGVVIGLVAITAALVAATVAQTAMNLAVVANPYVAAAVAIVALAAAMVVLYKKFAFVRRHWQLLLLGFGLAPVVVATVVKAIIRHWDSIKPVLQSVGRVATAVFNSIRAVAVPVFNTIRASVTASITAAKVAFQTLKPVAVATFNAIRAAVSAVVGPIVTFVSWVRAAIGAVQSLANAIRSLPSPSLGDVGNAILPGNPFGDAATGGHITTSGLLNVHRGEDLIPARITRNAGTGTGNGSSGGRMEIALIAAGPDVIRQLRELERRARLGGSVA